MNLDGVALATKELVDTEARKITAECYEQALATPRGSRDRPDWRCPVRQLT